MKVVRKIFLPDNRDAVSVVMIMVGAALFVTSANITGKHININERKNKKKSLAAEMKAARKILPGNRDAVSVVKGVVGAVISLSSANIVGKHITINESKNKKESNCRDESDQIFLPDNRDAVSVVSGMVGAVLFVISAT